MRYNKYDPGYSTNSRSLFPPENYKPLSDEERRELIHRLSAKIRREMEMEARTATGCPQLEATAVLNSPGSTTTEAVVLNFPEPSKICTSCHEEKPLAEFYNHPKGRNGKHPECKACMKAKALAHKRAA